ncbi:hypothetical protein PLICRDRAFT_91731 [Plicaturopsis crispa FD-325 SS-3]|nr:hypothetical protein PLICRDRAFT_91731 [Plicaturopsis crispa FD-325 SS-3]
MEWEVAGSARAVAGPREALVGATTQLGQQGRKSAARCAGRVGTACSASANSTPPPSASPPALDTPPAVSAIPLRPPYTLRDPPAPSATPLHPPRSPCALRDPLRPPRPACSAACALH